MIQRRVVSIVATLLISACANTPQRMPPSSPRPSAPRSPPNTPDVSQRSDSGGYYQNDGPPDDENIDIAAIPDAIPRHVSRSEHGNPDSYEALGHKYYVLKSAAGFSQTGRASWYGRQFHGERTSSGEAYDMYAMTAAHKRLPIPSYVRVTNLKNHKKVVVRVNDRGPFHDGRIIDLSYVAARKLGIVNHGSARVRIKTIQPAVLRQRYAKATRVASQPSGAKQSSAGDNTATGAGHGTRLYLQNGAFSQAPNARRLRTKLHRAGFKRASIVAPDATSPYYRVRIGPFDTPGRRQVAALDLRDNGFAVSEVTRHGVGR